MTYIVNIIRLATNFLKYTHKNKPIVYQKQTKNGFKNNININKDNFTNLLTTFFVKVQLKKSTNERNFSIFCRCFACGYAGCSHPATGQIFKYKTWLFIGSRNFCRVQGIARANVACVACVVAPCSLRSKRFRGVQTSEYIVFTAGAGDRGGGGVGLAEIICHAWLP